MGTGDVRYVVSVEDKGFTQKVEEFDKAIEDLGKTTTGAGAEARGLGQEIFSKLVPAFTVATLAADAIRGAFRNVKQAFVDTVQAAIEQESADRALTASLELTGREVRGNVAHYKQYAEALQKTTIYGDEQIQSVQTLLIQMTSLSRDGIDRATRSTIGLASVMGMDLHSAAMLVQKALEGNFGGAFPLWHQGRRDSDARREAGAAPG